MRQYFNFITNSKETLLSEVIKGIFPTKTAYLDFLAGYFYCLDIEEIFENISDRKKRTLVGVEMEKGLHNKNSEFDLFVNCINKQIEFPAGCFNENFTSLNAGN